jgi:hypothetical protein
MNDSAIALVSKPRRRVRYWLQRGGLEPVDGRGRLAVANEKRVSGPSETRVMEGAGLARGDLLHRRQALGHEGNR